jgi:DNA-binding NarL/FixJ family response regulator
MERIKVLLVDDHTIFRRGIASILRDQENLDVVGEASDGNEGVEAAKRLHPDVVLMDLNMPNCGGLEATLRLQTEAPGANILVLTVSEKESDLFGAVRAGARGYLLKESEPEELIEGIHQIARGGVIVSPAMAAKLLGELRSERQASEGEAPADVAALSQREVEVLQEVAKGASNKAIAATLYISENTVKTHLRNIMDKLHLANRSQAAAYAVQAGLLRHGKPPASA